MAGEDLSGQRFGSLLVVGRSKAPDRHNRIMWICRCDCGRARTVSTRELKRGRTLYSKNLYTADDLERAEHTDELTADGRTHVRIDYKVSGIGSNSCGPQLMEQYQLKEKQIRFRFTMLPGKKA